MGTTHFSGLATANITASGDVTVTGDVTAADSVAANSNVRVADTPGTATVLAKTANYTVLAADFGKVITNTGASGAITLTLPAASTVSGKTVKIAALAAQIVNISPAATDGIFLNGSGVDNKDVIIAGVIGNSVTIKSNGTNYEAYYANGVVTKEG